MVKYIISFILLIFAYNLAEANESNVYRIENQAKHDLKTSTYIIKSDALNIPITHIATDVYDSLFVPITSVPSTELPENCWSKVAITVPRDVRKEWILFTGSEENDIVDVFLAKNGRFVDFKRTGYYTPTESNVEWETNYNHIPIKFPVTGQEESYTLYLRYRSLIFKTPVIGISLSEPQFFYESKSDRSARHKFMLGLIVGCAVIMAIVAGLNYYFARDKAFLYVAIAGFTLNLYVFYTSGSMDLFVPMNGYSYFVIQLICIVTHIAYTLLIRHLVLLDKLPRIWLYIINTSFALAAINFIYSLISVLLYDMDPSYLNVDWIISPLQTLIYTITSFRLLLSKNTYTYLMAFANLVGSLMVCTYFVFFIFFNIDMIMLLLSMFFVNTLFYLTALVFRLWSIQNGKHYFQIAEIDRLEAQLSKLRKK